MFAALRSIAIRLFRANFGPAQANYAYRLQSARFLLFPDIVRHALRIHCASTFEPRLIETSNGKLLGLVRIRTVNQFLRETHDVQDRLA